jgi:hypothetical protein
MFLGVESGRGQTSLAGHRFICRPRILRLSTARKKCSLFI